MKRVLTGILWCLAIGMVYSVLIRQSGQGERMEGISTVCTKTEGYVGASGDSCTDDTGE